MLECGSPTDRFIQTLRLHHQELHRGATQILQINVGKKCNQTCMHCHVNAGPARTEIMTRATMDAVLDWLAPTAISIVDITGGAPELNPDFRYLIEQLKGQSRQIIDRCNLTVLFEPNQHDLAEFLAACAVEIVASLPCYTPETVAAQRGEGVFEKSIRALQKLNALGYGTASQLPLHLVYNPSGAFLPAAQAELETAYKKQLHEQFGIVFNRLYTLTNMPIARFAAFLRRSGQLESYQQTLLEAFNPASVPGLMCRNTINVGWRGEVYDCDFNQMLEMPWRENEAPEPLYLWDINSKAVPGRPIQVGAHCFGCTAGDGSSCGGALVK